MGFFLGTCYPRVQPGSLLSACPGVQGGLGGPQGRTQMSWLLRTKARLSCPTPEMSQKPRCPAFQKGEAHPSEPSPEEEPRCPASTLKKKGTQPSSLPHPHPKETRGPKGTPFVSPLDKKGNPGILLPTPKGNPSILLGEGRAQASCYPLPRRSQATYPPPHNGKPRRPPPPRKGGTIASSSPSNRGPDVLPSPPQTKGETQTFRRPQRKEPSRLPFPNKSPAILRPQKGRTQPPGPRSEGSSSILPTPQKRERNVPPQ